MPPLPFLGKSAVITGASRGIGLAIAHRLSHEGASCLLVGRDEGRLRTAVSQLESSRDHTFIVGDVKHLETWEGIKHEQPKVDFLINAAGLSQRSLLTRTSPETIESILDTNLKGAILGCKVLSKEMVRGRTRGCIINVSSLLGLHGGHGATVYAASKAGLIGFTRALVNELKPFSIRANVLVPGYIRTEMIQDLNEDSLIQKVPLGRLGEVDEVAEAAHFLLSNQYANNCVLNLDGGLSAT